MQLQGDGSFAYVPFAGFSGLDSFLYRATDSNGTTTDVEVTIHAGVKVAMVAVDADVVVI